MKFLAVTGVGLAFGLSVTITYLEQANRQGLHDVKLQLKAAGMPLKPEELQAPLPPAAENAAPLYVQLTQLLKAKPLAGTDKVLDDGSKNYPASAERIAQLRTALQHRQDILQLVHQAAARPRFVFTRDYAQGPYLLLPEYAPMRAGLRILTRESLVLLADGKPLDAIRNETLGFHMAQHAAADSILIAKLVGVALNTMTLRFMERVLYTAGDQPGVAQAVADTIAQNWKLVNMADGMRGEVILGEVVCDMIRAGKFHEGSFKNGNGVSRHSSLYKALVDANELDLLSHLNTEIKLMKQPYAEGISGMEALAQDIEIHNNLPTHLLTSVLWPVFSQARAKQAQGEAQAATVRASAQALAYHQQHRVFPDSLETVVSPLPLDPFAANISKSSDGKMEGTPLHYQREDNGFTIYSVGPTGKFSGGTTLHKPDSRETVFHFPMPAYYLQK